MTQASIGPLTGGRVPTAQLTNGGESPPAKIIERLIEVTDDLHNERGNREALLEERQGLLKLARELHLIPAGKDPHQPG